jgi:uncharacterized protein
VTETRGGSTTLELDRARSCLKSAELLADAGHHADAISRAYYAVFHAASALLTSIGRSARTHDGLRALVSEHFIRPGVLGAEHGRAMARLAGDRSDADYNVAAVFTDGDVREDLTSAAAFIAAVERILAKRAADS